MTGENDKNHKVRVAQYLRMSTDHQQYSLHNQSEYIKNYAEKNNMEIAYTYDDAGNRIERKIILAAPKVFGYEASRLGIRGVSAFVGKETSYMKSRGFS